MKIPRKTKHWVKELQTVLLRVLQAVDEEVENAKPGDPLTPAQAKRLWFEISYEISDRRQLDIKEVAKVIPGLIKRALETADHLPEDTRTSDMLVVFLYLHAHLELGLMSPSTLQKILHHMSILEQKATP